MLEPTIQLPGLFSFRNTMLHLIMDKLYDELNKKLLNADNICLITDIQTNSFNSDFIGLASVPTYSTYDREIVVINMMLMTGTCCIRKNSNRRIS